MTLFAINLLNSSDTSFYLAKNMPYNLKGPTKTGFTGQNINLSAIKLVSPPTTAPPTGSIQFLGKSICYTICSMPRRNPKPMPEFTRKSSSFFAIT